MRSETCSICGQEVRWGWRDEREAYWHRDVVDHEPIFGRRFTEADKAEVQRQLDLEREREVPTKDGGTRTVTYTARGYMLERMAKAKRERLLEEGLDEEEIAAMHTVEIPDPEVRRTPIERDDDRCVQGARNLMNAAKRAGWEITRLTYARGPYLGAKGQVLSISDSLVMHLVDGAGHAAVASWRGNKINSVWYGNVGGKCDMITITELKARMKDPA